MKLSTDTWLETSIHRDLLEVHPGRDVQPITRGAAVAYFDQMIANIRNPQGYAMWMVPVVSARRTTKG